MTWTCCVTAGWPLFGGVRAPSTLGTFLRAFTWGQARQLESAVRTFTCNLAAHTGLVPTGDEVMFVDIDSKVKQVYGSAKQGASFGYTKQLGLHFQIVTVKTSTCAPVITATRLRKGSANSGKGASSLLREALKTVRAMGVTAQIIVRAGSLSCPDNPDQVVDLLARHVTAIGKQFVDPCAKKILKIAPTDLLALDL